MKVEIPAGEGGGGGQRWTLPPLAPSLISGLSEAGKKEEKKEKEGEEVEEHFSQLASQLE